MTGGLPGLELGVAFELGRAVEADEDPGVSDKAVGDAGGALAGCLPLETSLGRPGFKMER
jgi:hypothetical protein